MADISNLSVFFVSWKLHDMVTISVLLVIGVGKPPVIGGFSSQGASDVESWFLLKALNKRWPVDSPHKSQWRGALMFCLIWINGWVNNRDAGDLRRHRAHYDITVMAKRGPIIFAKLLTTSYIRLWEGQNSGCVLYWRFWESQCDIRGLTSEFFDSER